MNMNIIFKENSQIYSYIQIFATLCFTRLLILTVYLLNLSTRFDCTFPLSDYNCVQMFDPFHIRPNTFFEKISLS